MASTCSTSSIGSSINITLPLKGTKRNRLFSLLLALVSVGLALCAYRRRYELLSSSSSWLGGEAVTHRRVIAGLFLTERFLSSELSPDTNKLRKRNADPIDPRDKICRDYLKLFLKGTTDAHDECHGLLNAYEAASCTEEIEKNPASSASGSRTRFVSNSLLDHSSDGGKNRTEPGGDGDDAVPAIDDFFEEFKCCRSIRSFYTARCHDQQQLASFSLLGSVLVLILCALVKSLIRSLQIQYLPEAGGCIIVGAVVGGILTASFPEYEIQLASFNDDVFLYILLPPIIFEAALSINKAKFRELLFPIAMFAVFGTFLTAVLTGAIVHCLTLAGTITTIPLLDSMIFGALISSVDPVATLSILSSMGISDTNTLYVLVFGESLLNDGVSIALFDSLVLHLNKSKPLDRSIVQESLLFFLKVTSGSIAVGLGCGVLCTVYFWALNGKQSSGVEVGSFFLFALIPYYISDGIHWSGIVSIMTAGFVMDYFVRGRHLTEEVISRSLLLEEIGDDAHHAAPRCAFPSYLDFRIMFSGAGHMSNRAKQHVGFVAEVIATTMETAIFAYLGVFLFSDTRLDDIPLAFIGIFACVVSRIVMVAAVSLIVNGGTFTRHQCRKLFAPHTTLLESQSKDYIDNRMQLILLFSGIRGAVSLALVENIPLYNAVTKEGSLFKPELKAMTLSSIIFTLFVFGASSYYILRKQQDDLHHYRERTDEVGDSFHELLLNDLPP